MKKIIAILTPLFLLVAVSAKAEIGMGVTGAMHSLDASGTEKTTGKDTVTNTGSHSNDVLVPELFIESIADNGLTLGLSYVPTREMGSKSRTDTNTLGDTGTYTAKAELDNVVQVYADVPLPSVIGYPVHLKLGVQHVTLATLESLNSGSTYPDADLLGLTVGIGTKGDLPYGDNMYYKAEATYTEFEDYQHSGSAGNTLEASFDDTAVKLSIGYKF